MNQSPALQRPSPSTLLRRTAARFLDLALVVALALLVARLLTPQFHPTQLGRHSEVRFVLTLFGIPLLAMAYEAVLVAWPGQTLGKLATGVRVQRLDGTGPGLARSSLRAVPWLVFLVPCGRGAAVVLCVSVGVVLQGRTRAA